MKRIVLVFAAGALLAGCSTQASREAEMQRMRSAEYNAQLGITYLREGNLEQARGKLHKALEQNDEHAVAHNAMGVLQEKLGKDDLAEKHFKKAIRYAPKDSDARNNYAQFLCRAKRIEDAEKEFLRAVDDPLYEGRATAMTNFGLCLMAIPDLNRAEDWFRQALQADTKNVPALYWMAQLSFERERHLAARGFLQRFEQLSKHTPQSLWLGVRIERELGGRDREASLGVMLKGMFPESDEAELYRKFEKKPR